MFDNLTKVRERLGNKSTDNHAAGSRNPLNIPYSNEGLSPLLEFSL
jgi:hypothetical protein